MAGSAWILSEFLTQTLPSKLSGPWNFYTWELSQEPMYTAYDPHIWGLTVTFRVHQSGCAPTPVWSLCQVTLPISLPSPIKGKPGKGVSRLSSLLHCLTLVPTYDLLLSSDRHLKKDLGYHLRWPSGVLAAGDRSRPSPKLLIHYSGHSSLQELLGSDLKNPLCFWNLEKEGRKPTYNCPSGRSAAS